MRMRKKKHLAERLERCTNVTVPQIDDLNFAHSDDCLLDTAAIFGNSNAVELEIGCGKGQFICELAHRRPDTNFIAVERSQNVLVSACERAAAERLSNVHFLAVNAEYLPRYLARGSVRRIYLNFSCPFPKPSYASHRLTAPRFLDIYRTLLSSGGQIDQKTDNRGLFEFSIECLSHGGFLLRNVSVDLHADGCEDNIVTEYEARFVALGQPIYRLEAYMPEYSSDNIAKK